MWVSFLLKEVIILEKKIINWNLFSASCLKVQMMHFFPQDDDDSKIPARGKGWCENVSVLLES